MNDFSLIVLSFRSAVLCRFHYHNTHIPIIQCRGRVEGVICLTRPLPVTVSDSLEPAPRGGPGVQHPLRRDNHSPHAQITASPVYSESAFLLKLRNSIRSPWPRKPTCPFVFLRPGCASPSRVPFSPALATSASTMVTPFRTTVI